MKQIEAQGPVSLAMEKVSEVIAILHDLIDEELRKAPDGLKVQATDALSSTKKLMNELLEYMQGHKGDKAEGSTEKIVAELEDKGQFVMAQKVREL